MSDVNLHVALLWAPVGQWFCMAAKLESRQSLTLGDVSCVARTQSFQVFTSWSRRKHTLWVCLDNKVLSKWNAGNGEGVTSHSPSPTAGLSYTLVPLTSGRGSACEFCASVRTYCIQTTGSFSVAPPSLESDLMVLEPKIGFWNMFHSAYCLKVDYAVTRIVSSFLWIEIQYYNHPKKKHVLHITRPYVQKKCDQMLYLFHWFTQFCYLCKQPMRQILCWICERALQVSAFHDSSCLSRKWQANEGSSAGGHGEPGSDHRASERVQHDPRRLLHGPHWHRHESQGGGPSLCSPVLFASRLSFQTLQ